jgi:hypothetical protein
MKPIGHLLIYIIIPRIISSTYHKMFHIKTLKWIEYIFSSLYQKKKILNYSNIVSLLTLP